MLVRLENNLPTADIIQEAEFLERFPSVSFPAGLQGVDLVSYSYAWYEFTDQPVPERYQKVIEGSPVQVNYDTWKQTWDFIPMSPSERQQVDDKQADFVRLQRNGLLSTCDWTQLSDSPLTPDEKVAWQLYRENLRLVPQQAGFPWDVVWPSKPGT